MKKIILKHCLVHEKPNERRLTQVYPMLKGLGVTYNGDTSCYGLQKLLKSVEGKRYEDFVNGQVLRCLSKAKYQPEVSGTDHRSSFPGWAGS